MSPIVTLADEGYRQFGPLPAAGGGLTAKEIAKAASKLADYDAADAWVRRRARKKGGRLVQSFEIVDVLDRNADLGGDRLAFVDKYLSLRNRNSRRSECHDRHRDSALLDSISQGIITLARHVSPGSGP